MYVFMYLCVCIGCAACCVARCCVDVVRCCGQWSGGQVPWSGARVESRIGVPGSGFWVSGFEFVF